MGKRLNPRAANLDHVEYDGRSALRKTVEGQYYFSDETPPTSRGTADSAQPVAAADISTVWESSSGVDDDVMEA